MRKFKYIVAFALCILPAKIFLAQIIISGTVTDESNKFVKGVSVTITEPKDNRILAYALTDSKGHYQIPCKSSLKKLQIKVRALGYQQEQKIIENKGQTINFSLEPSVTKIKEVVITPPIVRKKDTVSYNVKSFADKKDRSIEEVIAKMPGMEVSTDGQILYQGKAINKFMIEGLDALDGRYSLATKNLAHDKVAKVQVLENYQPVKILDSLVFSDQAAVNIKLKNKVTFAGKAETGGGVSPLLWQVNATPMLFNPKRQIITSYQTNNTGYDASSQLKMLTEQPGSNDDSTQQMLSIQDLSPPSFPKEKWLDNNIHLLTSNHLITLKKDYKLRMHVSYLNDYQQKEGYTSTRFFTSNDTISLLEKKYNQLYFNSLKTNLTLENNTKQNYFKNQLHFQTSWDSQRGNITSDEEPLRQELSNQHFKLSNNLITFFPISKQLVTVESHIFFSKMPEELSLKPGNLDALLDDKKEYLEVNQKAESKTVYTDNSIHFIKALGHFTIYPKMGFLLEKQKLETDILTRPASTLPGDFSNNLNRLRTKTYFKNSIDYKKDNWQIRLNTPLIYNTLNLKDPALHAKHHVNRFTFAPKIYARYDLNAFLNVNASYELGNGFNADNIRYGYMLRNYRESERSNMPPSKTFNRNFNSGFSYRNPIHSLFAHLNYSYSVLRNNLLYDQDIQPDGTTKRQAIEKDNDKKGHSLSGNISKYFSDLKTNIALNSSLSIQSSEQIINSKSEEITDIKNRNLSINIKADTNLTDWLGLDYQVQWSLSKSKIQSKKNQNITTQSHKWNLNIYPSDRQYIGIKSVYFQNDLFSEKTNYFFTDMVYRYTLKKKKIDFELQWNNIFNIKNYKNVIIDDFKYIETGFKLRPMQILFKVRFSL